MRFHSLFIGSTLLLTNKAASAFVTRQAFQQSVTTPATATTMTTRYRILQRQQQHRLFMGFLSNLFKAPELASAQEIKAALQNMSRNKVTVIDVRSPGEIAEDGKVTIDGCKWINTPATPFGCPGLSSDTENILPDKNAPIILYCASGMRATKAKEVLEGQGYTNVMNAGGASQLRSFGL